MEREMALRRQIVAIKLEIASRELACAIVPPPPLPPLELPQETGQPKPQQVAELKPKEDLPQDKWDRKDVGVLEGCWQLGRDSRTTVTRGSRTEQCVNRTGRICFDGRGSGVREETTDCPTLGRNIDCGVKVAGSFDGKGLLQVAQPDVHCKDGTLWDGRNSSLTCRRVNERLAICRDLLGFEHEFRR